MRIKACVQNKGSTHEATVTTAETSRRLSFPTKETGRGSAINGGEFLMLALATCYCNDLFREAARLQIPLEAVEVEAMADFDGMGMAGKHIEYRARVASPAPSADVERLLKETDAVAEVQNTVRTGVPVTLVRWNND